MTDLTLAIDEAEETEESGENSALSPKKSLRGAINRYCRSCGYDSLDKGAGDWRQQIQACPVIVCELHSVRPMSKPRKAEELSLAPCDAEQRLPSEE